MIPFSQTLDYSLETGWLTPFVTGLQMGDVIARTCQSCACVSFPPQRVCPCGDRKGDWVTLAGTATIKWRTHGADGDFALAQFDGASTQTVLRLVGFDATQKRGKLIASGSNAPALSLAPISFEDK